MGPVYFSQPILINWESQWKVGYLGNELREVNQVGTVGQSDASKKTLAPPNSIRARLRAPGLKVPLGRF